MKGATLFQTRLFALAAAGLGVVAILILLIKPPEPKVAQAPLAAPAAQPALSVPLELTPPAPMQAVLLPQVAPHPPANSDLASVYPPPRLPDVATAEGAGVSLACLARNGADLSKPMPSMHCIFAANEQVATKMRAWGQSHGFEVRDFQMLRGHTGTPEYRFNLVRVEIPQPREIEREGRMILAAVEQIPGTYYQTWCGAVVH
jgi:hypothetical protein